MAKLNVYQPGTPRVPEFRAFEIDGPPWELTCREPNASDLAFAAEEADGLMKMFVTGRIEDGQTVSFPDPDVRPTHTHFITCCTVASCQVSLDPDERYSGLELAILSVKRPNDWAEVSAWIDGLCRRWEKRQGN